MWVGRDEGGGCGLGLVVVTAMVDMMAGVGVVVAGAVA